MKKTIYLLRLAIITICICSFAEQVKANFAAGGELTYQHISDSTYRFIFKLYRDCSGNTAPDSLPLCFLNSCTNTIYSVKMGKFGAVTKLGPGCPQYKTTCDSAASTLPGYEEHVYSVIYTIPARCTLWKAYTYVSNRSNSNNLQAPTTKPLYLEVTFNNTISHNNSSPFFFFSALPYVGLYQPNSLNLGVIDADGDSLWTQLVQPMTGVTNCNDTATLATFNTSSPPYNLTNNPIQTANSFAFNGSNAQSAFTSTTLGKGSIALRTREYRNGVLIGSMMREFHVNTLAISTTGPTGISATLGCGLSGPVSTPIYGCAGQNLSFCIDIESQDTAAIVKVLDDLSVSIPGATLTYTNQNTDSVHAVFSWTPGLNNVGNFRANLLITDSTCRPPGILSRMYQTLNITIWGPPKTLNDTFICPNGSMKLTTTGGTNYTWSILSGTPNSLSCTNCPSPIATPAVTTTYVVASVTNPLCPNNTDTVTVTVLPPSSTTYPSISISVAPDSNITFGDTVTFTANVTNCTTPGYQWVINGNNVTGETNSTFTIHTLVNAQKVWCKLTCDDMCPSPKDTISNIITMTVAVSVNDIQQSNNIRLYPNPNNGNFTIELKDMNKSQNTEIKISNIYGQVVHSATVTGSRQQLNLSSLPSGVYILSAGTGEAMYTMRFIIQ